MRSDDKRQREEKDREREKDIDRRRQRGIERKTERDEAREAGNVDPTEKKSSRVSINLVFAF